MRYFKKKRYIISARRAPIDTQFYNKLEDCTYTVEHEDDVVLTGTVGEVWLISGPKFQRTYALPDGREISPYALGPYNVAVTPKKSDTLYEATLMPISEGPFSVQTSDGYYLHGNRPEVPHGRGDYIVSEKGHPEAQWVVNGKVFENTYEEV